MNKLLLFERNNFVRSNRSQVQNENRESVITELIAFRGSYKAYCFEKYVRPTFPNVTHGIMTTFIIMIKKKEKTARSVISSSLYSMIKTMTSSDTGLGGFPPLSYTKATQFNDSHEIVKGPRCSGERYFFNGFRLFSVVANGIAILHRIVYHSV